MITYLLSQDTITLDNSWHLDRFENGIGAIVSITGKIQALTSAFAMAVTEHSSQVIQLNDRGLFQRIARFAEGVMTE